VIDQHVVSVEIQGHRYPIQSALDQEYIVRLAKYVDDKMRVATESTPTADNLRVAVLTALNIADELFRCRDANRDRDGRLAERTEEIERMLDRLLMA
jgi:cell division protein ZapA